ncbi:hypothetical protein OIV83_002471 [Microbotryomycetes sp. JL201]|nr:hypothetical protein OIV83_002471 [Microbotryomycetes sp. JL201]
MAESLGYTDAATYLNQPNFHRTTAYTSRTLCNKQLTVSYAVGGAFDVPDARTLVWINGLGRSLLSSRSFDSNRSMTVLPGGHRLSIAILDGICASFGVRVITFDRPGAGLSSTATEVPLRQRVVVTYESLMAILKQEQIKECSILSHSNGVIYSLYTVARLLEQATEDGAFKVKVRHWILTSPWVASDVSGSMFGLAKWLPEQLTSRLGTLTTWGLSAVDVGTGIWQGMNGIVNWSGGLSNGLSSSVSATQPLSATPATANDSSPPFDSSSTMSSAQQKYTNYVRSQAKKPPHKRFFPGLFIGAGVFPKAMSMALAEQNDAMGQEALLCLRKADGVYWSWLGGRGIGDDGQISVIAERELYRLGFERVRSAIRQMTMETGRPTQIRVCLWQAGDDGMVPQQGRQFLKDLLVDSLGLVDEQDSHMIDEAGHDDILSLECVMRPLLEMVASAQINEFE